MPSVVIRGDQPAGESVFIADIILQIYWVRTNLGWAHKDCQTVLYSRKGSPLSPTIGLYLNLSISRQTDVTGWRLERVESIEIRVSGLPLRSNYNLYLKLCTSLRKPVRPTQVIRSQNYIKTTGTVWSFILEAQWMLRVFHARITSRLQTVLPRSLLWGDYWDKIVFPLSGQNW